jgi:hypothetical protein
MCDAELKFKFFMDFQENMRQKANTEESFVGSDLLSEPLDAIGEAYPDPIR